MKHYYTLGIVLLTLASCTQVQKAQDPQTTGEEAQVKQSDDLSSVCYVVPTPELKARLSAEEWNILVEAGTEPPFQNAYWDNHKEGIYVDKIDGTPLFASVKKFDSGSGWPSFWEPIDKDSIVLIEDKSFGMVRTEVRAKKSGGHLGHVFNDGPKPTGKRFCINSASLRFVDRGNLSKSGLGELEKLFN